MSDKIDASCTRDLTCPYCGYEFEDSWDCDQEGVIECHNSLCGKRFSYYSDHVTYFWSQRDCAENGEKHHWLVKYDLYEGTVSGCSKCDQIKFEEKEPDATVDPFPVDGEEAVG